METRAETVKEYLEPKVSGADITFQTEGRGASEPHEPNSDEDGKDLPDNRAKNRRVSFQFSGEAPQATGPGAKNVEDVLEMKKLETADGALMSVELYNPRGVTGPVRFDIQKVTEDGEFTRFDFGFASQEGPRATFFLEPHDGGKAFGRNGYGNLMAPTTTNISLVGDTGAVLKPARAGGRACLCSATSILGNGALAQNPAPMYAYFPTRQMVRLQIAESGTVDIDLNKLKAESRGWPTALLGSQEVSGVGADGAIVQQKSRASRSSVLLDARLVFASVCWFSGFEDLVDCFLELAAQVEAASSSDNHAEDGGNCECDCQVLDRDSALFRAGSDCVLHADECGHVNSLSDFWFSAPCGC